MVALLVLALAATEAATRQTFPSGINSGDTCGGACVKSSGPAAESCCADSKGWSCCIAQTSACVPEDPALGFPARCCPRWTVGCDSGSVGCCDPAMPWQWSLPAVRKTEATKARKATKAPSPVTTVSGMAWAMFQEGEAFRGGLKVLGVNLASGQIEEQHVVTGFENDFGESTRDFLFDYKRQKFYYLDANFTANMGVRPTEGRDVLLYTVDAATGRLTKATVTGAKDFPTGMVMNDETGMILMATEGYDGGTNFTSFDFFSLDPTTATAKPIGSVQRGSDESAAGFYAGYFRTSDSAATTAYRLGFQMVSQQMGQGLGSATISSGTIDAKWDGSVSAMQGHDFYMSMDRYGDDFVSLAPSTFDRDRKLDLVKLSLGAGGAANASVVAKLGDAHPPRSIGGGNLGYMASFVHGDAFMALVEAQNPGGKFERKDHWAVSVVDLASGEASTLPLLPKEIAGTWSVAGLGLATA